MFKESLPNPESENKHSALFERIKESKIYPANESELWNPEQINQEAKKLELTLNNVFKEYGETALQANSGKIITPLSGGLDSTTALAILRNNFPENEIITFSMGGSENHPDIQHARLASQQYKTNHHEIIPNSDEINVAIIEYGQKFPKENLEEATKSGDVDTYLLYKSISQYNPKKVMIYDGIDELMGGYWPHRANPTPETFQKFWDELIPNHLKPLMRITDYFNIESLFPYLDQKIIQEISQIPLKNRTSREESKIPLRIIAKNIGVPELIISRRKLGRVGMLDAQGKISP